MKSVVIFTILFSAILIAPANNPEPNYGINKSLYNRPVIYQHAAFNRYDPGEAEVSIGCTEFNLNNVGWNDTISSIYIPRGQGWEVVIYEASHFQGRWLSFRRSVVNLDKYRFNDITSSIKIYKRGVLQGDCIWH